jgi:hypothetical protein
VIPLLITVSRLYYVSRSAGSGDLLRSQYLTSGNCRWASAAHSMLLFRHSIRSMWQAAIERAERVNNVNRQGN